MGEDMVDTLDTGAANADLLKLKPKHLQLLTMEDMVDTADMVDTLDTGAANADLLKPKQKHPQLLTMADMADTEDMVDTDTGVNLKSNMEKTTFRPITHI